MALRSPFSTHIHATWPDGMYIQYSTRPELGYVPPDDPFSVMPHGEVHASRYQSPSPPPSPERKASDALDSLTTRLLLHARDAHSRRLPRTASLPQVPSASALRSVALTPESPGRLRLHAATSLRLGCLSPDHDAHLVEPVKLHSRFQSPSPPMSPVGGPEDREGKHEKPTGSSELPALRGPKPARYGGKGGGALPRSTSGVAERRPPHYFGLFGQLSQAGSTWI